MKNSVILVAEFSRVVSRSREIFIETFNWNLSLQKGCILLAYLISISISRYFVNIVARWLGGLLVERRTSVSQIRGSIPRQVAAV